MIWNTAYFVSKVIRSNLRDIDESKISLRRKYRFPLNGKLVNFFFIDSIRKFSIVFKIIAY